jgi:hypothetical protein
MFYFLKDYKKQKQEMLSEIKDLQITIETLKSKVTDLYNEFSLIQNANPNKVDKELEWFEDDEYLHSRYEELTETCSSFDYYREFRNYAEYLKKEKKIKYIKENASLKIRQVHHGGCLSCTTPINEGIKSCLGCKYFNGVVSNYPDLSKKYSSEKDSQHSR